MQHPFKVLQPEYSMLLGRMVITRKADVVATARRLLRNLHFYQPVSAATGIPTVFIAASFEREASSDFTKNPAQGDSWMKVSTHVPKGRGPFRSWADAALDAYALNGLDKVGAQNWTWELLCFYGELFNGMGYRNRGLRSPYLWGGSNLQQPGKYVADGKFDSAHFDQQLGIVPMMKEMVTLVPTLDLLAPVDIPDPIPVPVGVGGAPDGGHHDTEWIQHALNVLIDAGLGVDGNYGRLTREAVKAYQRKYSLEADGFAGPKTIADMVQRLKAQG